MVHKPGQPFSSFARWQAPPERRRDGLKGPRAPVVTSQGGAERNAWSLRRETDSGDGPTRSGDYRSSSRSCSLGCPGERCLGLEPTTLDPDRSRSVANVRRASSAGEPRVRRRPSRTARRAGSASPAGCGTGLPDPRFGREPPRATLWSPFAGPPDLPPYAPVFGPKHVGVSTLSVVADGVDVPREWGRRHARRDEISSLLASLGEDETAESRTPSLRSTPFRS